MLEQRVGPGGLQRPFWLQPLGDPVIPKAKEQVATSHVNWPLGSATKHRLERQHRGGVVLMRRKIKIHPYHSK